MDTSKTYIEMCEKAEEIQKFAYRSQRKEKWNGEWVYKHTKNKAIWLPRQDQLQEMITKTYDKEITRPWVHLCGQFYKWAHLNWCDFTSMEQLWLAFVMKEKYNKTWNGSEWISI